MSIHVLDPTVAEETIIPATVAGFTSLAGRTVGLLDNSKINVRPFLDHMETILRTQYGVKTVVRLKKADASRPAPPEVVAAMTGCEVVISAVGD